MRKMLLFTNKIVYLTLKMDGVVPVDLDEYLFRKKISQTDFAKDLEISRNHLGEILRARRSPSVKLAKKIEELTQGEVSRERAMFPKGRE